MNLAPLPIQKFFGNNGRPLDGGLLFTYTAGTTTKVATYQDEAGTPNTNPIELNFRGEANVWLDPELTYKFVLSPRDDTDPPTASIWTVDNIASSMTLADLTQAIIGRLLWPRTDAEIAAATTPTSYAYNSNPYDIRRYGAIECSHTNAAQQALNKTALQVAIDVLNDDLTDSGGAITVPNGCQYGYDFDDSTTWPDFTNTTRPMVVIDYSLGDSFSGYPTAYDGAQIRYFFNTPFNSAAITFTGTLALGATSGTLTGNWTEITGPWAVTFSNGDVRNVTFTNGATTATWTSGLSAAATASATYTNTGQNLGNLIFVRANWNPGIFLSNDSNIAAVGDPTRLAQDNRRTQISFGSDGLEGWKVGQGTLNGQGYTSEELSNFAIEKIALPGDTLGSFPSMIVERKTGNISFGLGGNVPVTSFAFSSNVVGFDQMMIENIHDTQSRIFMRPALGSTHDGGIGVDSSGGSGGNLFLWFRSSGHAIDIDRVSRRVNISTLLVTAHTAVSYSASVTYSASAANQFTLTVTNTNAFTINAPTEAVTNAVHTLTVRNTSGGVMGTITWDAVFKQAFTAPANGFSRTATFRYDGTNWVMTNMTPVDVPN